MTKKFFTPHEANKILPFVREDVERLQQTKREFLGIAMRLRELRMSYEQMAKKPPEDELFQMEARMEFLQIEAKALTDSIRLKGAELKDVDRGLVDFPAMIDGEEVLLCWRLGEERIEYYHSMREGYRARRPLSEKLEEQSEDFF